MRAPKTNKQTNKNTHKSLATCRATRCNDIIETLQEKDPQRPTPPSL